MSVKPVQGTYEKLSAAGLFLVVAALGWGPFIFRAGEASYLERAFLFITLAIGFLSLALIYDAAERFLARGRGVYFAAIFCSIPATGALITDPGLLSVAMLMLLVSAAVWLTARAEGEQRIFLLAMLAGLLLIAGCAFFVFPGSIAFAVPIWLAVSRSSRRTLVAVILTASYGAGMLLRLVSGLGLTGLELPPDSMGALSSMSLMPWRIYALLVLLLLIFVPRTVKSWHIGVLATCVATSAVAAATGANMTVIGALLAPGLTLLAGDLSLESFEPDLEKRRRRLLIVPPLLIAAFIAVATVSGRGGFFGMPALTTTGIVTGATLAVLLFLTVMRRLPRWTFALLFLTGMWFSSFFWPPSELLPAGTRPATSSIPWPFLAIVLVAGFAGYYLYYGRRIPKRSLPDGGFLFGGDDFRRFDRNRVWEGESIPAGTRITGPYSFIIFGDVTGSESPFAGRHGGYFTFRGLTEQIKQRAPAFAISLGDLSTQATALSFRRLRQLLRRIPVPMTAIPGNHDLFRDTRYDARYFESLFGADHRAFRAGPVQFVLINNASGAFEESQFAWLEQTLRSSNAAYVLVFCHKPLFDPRPDGSYAMETRDQAQRLHELFRTHEVTAVLSGHIHALLSEIRDGVTYIVSGGGGSRLATAEEIHHYLTADVTAEALTIHAWPVEADAARPSVALLELHFTPRTCSSAAHATSPAPSAS